MIHNESQLHGRDILDGVHPGRRAERVPGGAGRAHPRAHCERRGVKIARYLNWFLSGPAGM